MRLGESSLRESFHATTAPHVGGRERRVTPRVSWTAWKGGIGGGRGGERGNGLRKTRQSRTIRWGVWSGKAGGGNGVGRSGWGERGRVGGGGGGSSHRHTTSVGVIGWTGWNGGEGERKRERFEASSKRTKNGGNWDIQMPRGYIYEEEVERSRRWKRSVRREREGGERERERISSAC